MTQTEHCSGVSEVADTVLEWRLRFAVHGYRWSDDVASRGVLWHPTNDGPDQEGKPLHLLIL